LVLLARREIGLKSSYPDYTNAIKTGKYVDKRLKWTGDDVTEDVPDYFSSPIESILEKRKDCEDHAFLAASLNEDLGVAFGLCGTGGHAFNVFIKDDELWVLETNSTRDYDNCVKAFKYKNQTHYKIHWIFTKDKTFKCLDRPLNFGNVVR